MLSTFAGHIQRELDALRENTSQDFAALAWKDTNGYTIRWRFASGALGERYKRIVLKPGPSIAGIVLRTERPYQVNTMHLRPGEEPQHYAIMLAEHLKAAAGAPVFVGNHVPGVVLIGSRQPHPFEPSALAELEAVAARLGALIEPQRRERTTS